MSSLPFKAGDFAWYFEFPEDGCGGFDVSDVKLCTKQLYQHNIDYGGYLYYAYTSKEQALTAMRKRLDELENEYQTDDEI